MPSRLAVIAIDANQPQLIVLADPEGNEFCLLSRVVQEL